MQNIYTLQDAEYIHITRKQWLKEYSNSEKNNCTITLSEDYEIFLKIYWNQHNENKIGFRDSKFPTD